MNLSSFGARLRYRREKLGFSQEKLAEIADASENSIVKWERLETADSGIQWKKFIKLCAALKANPGWMKTGEGPEDIDTVAKETRLNVESVRDRLNKAVKKAEAMAPGEVANELDSRYFEDVALETFLAAAMLMIDTVMMERVETLSPEKRAAIVLVASRHGRHDPEWLTRACIEDLVKIALA